MRVSFNHSQKMKFYAERYLSPLHSPTTFGISPSSEFASLMRCFLHIGKQLDNLQNVFTGCGI